MSDRTLRSFGIAQLSTGALFAVIGFMLGIGFDFYTFRETQRTTAKIEELRLARDMYNEFYFGRPVYRDIRTSIESCKPLYKSWGGPFTHDEINQYLGFFTDLGFFHRSGFLSADVIAHFFGAYMIEAFENPELQKYVSQTRTNFSQPEAFKDYYELVGTMRVRKEMAGLAASAQNMCREQPKEAQDATR
jgi:hypothetical protein